MDYETGKNGRVMAMVPASATPPLLMVIPMKCPSCGAGLQISQQMDSFACGYCGTSIRTVRQGGTVSLLIEAVTKVQIATDRTAAELALARLGKELDQLDKEIAELEKMEEPSPPMKPSFSLWGYLVTPELERSMRKVEESHRRAYPKARLDWEVAQERKQKLKQQRTEVAEKMATNRKVVD